MHMHTYAMQECFFPKAFFCWEQNQLHTKYLLRSISGSDRRERTVRSVLKGQSVLFYHNHYCFIAPPEKQSCFQSRDVFVRNISTRHLWHAWIACRKIVCKTQISLKLEQASLFLAIATDKIKRCLAQERRLIQCCPAAMIVERHAFYLWTYDGSNTNYATTLRQNCHQ